MDNLSDEAKTYNIKQKQPIYIRLSKNAHIFVKQHKKMSLFAMVLLFVTFASWLTYRQWASKHYLPKEGEEKILSEARKDLSEGNVEKAGEKYKFIIEKKTNKEDREVAYSTWSKDCLDYGNKADCALSVWNEKGKDTTKDYKYYIVQGNLYMRNNDLIEGRNSYQNAIKDASGRNDLTEEEKEYIKDLEARLNAKN